jgi:hypothetical protein
MYCAEIQINIDFISLLYSALLYFSLFFFVLFSSNFLCFTSVGERYKCAILLPH